MRHQMDEFTAAETDQLISELFETLPSFIQGLPDNKLLEDCYCAIRDYEYEVGYRWHRFKQQLFRSVDSEVQLLPYDGFRMTEAKYYHAALVGMLCSAADIFAATCTVYHPGVRKYHNLGKPNEVMKRMQSVAEKVVTSIETDWESGEVHEEISEIYERKVDVLPYMIFIFKFLRDRGYNWQYRSEFLEFAKRVEDGPVGPSADDEEGSDDENAEEFLPIEDADELAPDTPQYNTPSWADLTFESEYFKVVSEPPDTTVEAYIQVYGVEPDGYPPRMDEY